MSKKLRIRTKQGWIGYPGSTIQQNYGESVEGHGYLLWDIRKRDDFDVEFVNIPNHHPFVTLDWEDNVKKSCLKYPLQSRFRIRSQSYIPQKEARSISNWLVARGALEVVFKAEQEKSRAMLSDESQRLVDDVRNVEALLEYMKKYAKYVSYKFSKDDWIEIEKIVRDAIKTVSDDNDVIRHAKWTLKNVEWDNLYSYGEDNKIDFSTLNGVVGVFGPNRSGKSSLVGTLTYGLFNTSDRGVIKNLAVVNERKSYGLVKMDISSTQGEYYLERQTVKKENKKGEFSAPTVLNFYSRNSSEVLNDMSGEERKDTEKTVRKLLGTFEDFQMTGLSRQGDLNRFISEGSTQRKAILAKFLDLDYLEKLHEIIKADMNTQKYSTRGLYENYDVKIVEAKINLKTSTSNLAEQENQFNIAKSKIEDLKLSYANESIGSRLVTAEDIISHETILKRLEKELQIKNYNLKKIAAELIQLRSKKERIDELDKEYDLNDLKRQYRDQLTMETELAQKRAKYEKELADLTAKDKSVKKLLEVPCGDSFPTCKYIRDSHHDKLTINDQRIKVNEALDLLDNIKKIISDAKSLNVNDKIVKLEKLKDANTSISMQIKDNESKQYLANAEVSSLLLKIHAAKDKLDDLNIAASSDLGKKCSKIKSELEIAQSLTSNLERCIRNLYSEKGKCELELQNLVTNKDVAEKTLGKIKIYEFVAQSLSKRGIPALILRSQLPIINNEIEKILRGTVDFEIEFELDEDLNSMDIFVNYGDSKRYIELCSGMEKTIASIAIRVALINITSLPKPDFLILDEGFGSLDPVQIEPCGRLLQSLKKFFRFVIIITHVDSLKDYIDNSIEITRKEKDSYVSHS